jgi:hypothetical protein
MGGVCKRRYSSGGLSEITPNFYDKIWMDTEVVEGTK